MSYCMQTCNNLLNEAFPLIIYLKKNIINALKEPKKSEVDIVLFGLSSL